MKLEKVTATYSDKRQLSQFEPVTMSATFEASLEEGDDPEDVYTELLQMAKTAVGREMLVRLAEKEMSDDVGTER